MELQTISQVSKAYDISSRMLRYYEQIGLIKSLRHESNAYRLYDDDALVRIRQIIILRKLQIPVKQICVIMDNPDATEVIEIFRNNISGLDSEITALSTIKSILHGFVRELERAAHLRLNLEFLQNDSLLALAVAPTPLQRNGRERIGMSDLNRASDVLNKLKNVRVVYLPPMTVASAFFSGENAPQNAWQAIHDFVKRANLLAIKPDIRVFRIEHANATGKNFGNEAWVSIPDDFLVPAPLTKKRFLGGQYAAHVLEGDGFLTYLGLQDWINENERYQYDYDGNLARCEPPIQEVDSFGGIRLDPEEILNFHEVHNDSGAEIQYDVLFPVKRYQPVDDVPVEIPDSREKCGYRASIVRKNKFRIMGFTKIMLPSEPDGPNSFEEELKADGRLDILNLYRKPGAPILGFGSHDMDSQMRGGWRWTVCLAEQDVTGVEAFMRHDLFIHHIDAAKWLIFEHEKGEPFDDHGTCMKLGYTWNGVISGSFYARPDSRIGKPDPADEADMKSITYCWYPVK